MSRDSRIDEDWPRAGRLDESDDLRAIRALTHSPRGPLIRLKSSTALTGSARSLAPTLGPGYRALPITTTPASAKASTFHLRMSSTSKRPAPQIPRDIRRGHRVGLWPNRREVGLLKSYPEAKRHRSARMWSLPAGHAFLRTPIGQTLSSDFSKAIAHLGREINANKRALSRARQHQRYIERSGGYSKRADEIERDEKGPIIAGNIGLSPDATKAFWEAAVAEETRRDARLQNRLIVELPHWIQASDRRAIIERFGRVFDERNLPWFAAVHMPDRHGDKRNFHAHGVVGTRPFLTKPSSTDGEAGWTFAPVKDRKTQGPEWVTFLRRSFATIVNEVCAAAARRDGTEVKRIFFPGRAAEIGLSHTPSVHLGPARSALLRRGQGTAPRPVQPSLFDTIESAIRCFVRDSESIARATEKFDLLEEKEKDFGQRETWAVCAERIDTARDEVDACGEFLEQLFQDESTTPMQGDDGLNAGDFDADDVLWRFTRAGASVAAALVALDEYEADVRRDAVGRHKAEIAPPTHTPAKNDHRRLKEVDPAWAFGEIAARLDRPWVPRKIVDGKSIPIVNVEEGVAAITIGDDIELRLRHSTNLGWHVECPRERDEEWLRSASYDVRFWNKVVRSLISVVTRSLGTETVMEIVSRHGLVSNARLHDGLIVVERSNGILQVAVDGRCAAIYGDDSTLRAAFDEIAKVRNVPGFDMRAIVLLNGKSRPKLEGIVARPDRPVSLGTLLRNLDQDQLLRRVEWRYAADATHIEKFHQQALARFHPAPVEKDTLAPVAPQSATGSAINRDQAPHVRQREPSVTTQIADTRAPLARPPRPVPLRPAAPTLPTPRRPTLRQPIPVKRSQLSLLLKKYTIFVTDNSRAELLRRVRQFNLEELFVALEFTTFSLQQAEKRGEASTETSHQLGRGIRLLHDVLYEKNINPDDLDRRFKIVFDLEPTVAKPPPPSSAAISTSTSMSTQPPAPQKRRDRGWER